MVVDHHELVLNSDYYDGCSCHYQLYDAFHSDNDPSSVDVVDCSDSDLNFVALLDDLDLVVGMLLYHLYHLRLLMLVLEAVVAVMPPSPVEEVVALLAIVPLPV